MSTHVLYSTLEVKKLKIFPGSYLHTVMQRAPQAAAPSKQPIRLTLWAGEREGSANMARRAIRVKRGYPGG